MGKVLAVKIKEYRGPGSIEYKNEVNAEDYKQVALILLDLETHGIPVKKAIIEFKKMIEKNFPW